MQTPVLFSDADLAYLKTLNNPTWLDQLWKPSSLHRHNISMSGGSDKVTYFVGGNYQNENGNYAGIKQDKYGFRAGVVATIAKGLKADVNFNVDHRIRYSGNPTANEDQAFIEAMVQVPRWIPVDFNGKYVNIGGSNPNPLAAIGSGYYREDKTAGYRINTAFLMISLVRLMDSLQDFRFLRHQTTLAILPIVRLTSYTILPVLDRATLYRETV
ncbi:hypothetical protein LWM68_24465 [Niabella sp. W65]|nr:hypothetical protein [Niabella sp. W65]MCH7365651.1 hypothetical protein [Niabella sp. W65]